MNFCSSSQICCHFLALYSGCRNVMRWRIAWFSLVTLRSSLARFSLFKLRKTRFYKDVINNENHAILTFHTIKEIYVDFLKKIDLLKLQQGIKKNLSTLPLITVYFQKNYKYYCDMPTFFFFFFNSHLNLLLSHVSPFMEWNIAIS